MNTYDLDLFCPPNKTDVFYDMMMDMTMNTETSSKIWTNAVPIFDDYTTHILILSAMYTMSVILYNQYNIPNTIRASPTMLQIGRFWNLCMCVFSSCGVFYSTHLLWELTFTDKKFLNCGLFMYLYVWSKPFELIDTLIMMIKGRKIILLHWTHHVMTLLYCWYLAIRSQNIGVYFGVLNYFVHSFMYGYYFLISFNRLRPICKKYSKLITTLQLSQFVGALLGTIVFYNQLTMEIFLITLFMYFYYFLIFTKFYLTHYGKKKCTDCQLVKPKNIFIPCQQCKQQYCKTCLNKKNTCSLCDLLGNKFYRPDDPKPFNPRLDFGKLDTSVNCNKPV